MKKNFKAWWEVHFLSPGNDFTFVSVVSTREKARIIKRGYIEHSKLCKIFKVEERIAWNGRIYRFNIHKS